MICGKLTPTNLFHTTSCTANTLEPPKSSNKLSTESGRQGKNQRRSIRRCSSVESWIRLRARRTNVSPLVIVILFLVVQLALGDYCGKAGGIELWGPTSECFFYSIAPLLLIVLLSPSDRHLWFQSKNTSTFRAQFLPGLLERNWHVVNWVDRSVFYARINPPVHAIPVEEMFHEIIPLANEEEGTDDATMWSLDEWYCTECLDIVFKKTFWKWMLARQRKGTSSRLCVMTHIEMNLDSLQTVNL